MLRNKRVLLGIALVAAIPILAIAWWLGSPLFINKTVEEEFPLSFAAVVPEGMTRAEVEQVMAGMAKMNSEVAEAMPDMGSPARLKTGGFRDADSFHRGSGQATIYRGADGSLLLRLEDFSVTNGPDLHVLLTAHPDPRDSPQVKSGAYYDLGKLKGNRGNQNYEIAAGVDVSALGSVVIYCQPFHVVFSVASLSDAT